ncbi:MAG TPA: YncE family protein [Steroidobacteraceae bacterium]|jgi:YVTN family beta-propeller protein
MTGRIGQYRSLAAGALIALAASLLVMAAGTAQAASAHAASANAAGGMTLLVLNQKDKSLVLVDPNSLKILNHVEVGEDPHEVIASADGKLAYVSNYGSLMTPQHTLQIVDLTAVRLQSTIDLGALLAPHGLALADGRIYFTAEGSKVVGRYDPATAKVDMVVGLGQDRTHMLVVDQDGRRIFTSNVNSNSISVLQRDNKNSDNRWLESIMFGNGDVSGWIETVIPVGKGPEGFDVSPDAKELWAANTHDGTVSIIDVATLKVAQVVDVHMKSANRLKFTPDGRLVLISDLGNGDLVVVDAVSHQELKRLNLGHGAGGILMAPDGSRAYVAVSRDDYVAVIDLKTLTQIGRVATGQWPDGMAWAIRK